ncbi:MAG: N-acetyltransferase family protein [Roseobacter sp.]
MIRPAEARDAIAVAALWNQMIRDTLFTFTTVEKTFEEVSQLIIDRQASFWVAEGPDGIEGFVTYGSFRDGPGYAHTKEHTIIMGRAAQGNGTAGALLHHAQQRAAAQNIRVLVGAISAVNVRALRFHEKHGFTQSGHMRQVGRKQAQWLDLIVVQKNLAGTEHSH